MKKTAHLMGGLCSGVIATEMLIAKPEYAGIIISSSTIIGACILSSNFKCISTIKKIIFGKKPFYSSIVFYILLAFGFFMGKNLYDISNLRWLILYISLMLGSLVGSLFPDIDHPSSAVGSKVKLLSYIVGGTLGHRGATHAPIIHLILFAICSSLGKLLIPGFVGVVFIQFATGMFFGVISHLILDSLTVSGIPILYPIDKYKFRLAKLKAGKHDIIGIILCLIISIGFLTKFSIFT